MKPDGSWYLSPAYDLTYGVDLSSPAFLNRHSMTINGKKENITRKDLEAVAQRNDIQDYKALIDKVTNAVNKFKEYASELKIERELIENIESDFIRL
jgi:serine/threonine-protein kinase HipA